MVEYDLKDISSEMKTVAERRFTFRSGAVTSGRIDMNGRTSSRKRTTQNFMSKFLFPDKVLLTACHFRRPAMGMLAEPRTIINERSRRSKEETSRWLRTWRLRRFRATAILRKQTFSLDPLTKSRVTNCKACGILHLLSCHPVKRVFEREL